MEQYSHELLVGLQELAIKKMGYALQHKIVARSHNNDASFIIITA
jgi:hypothetical protein